MHSFRKEINCISFGNIIGFGKDVSLFCVVRTAVVSIELSLVPVVLATTVDVFMLILCL